ncbi:MAG: PAS domain S-box protein [Candidatus Melainabacteria bacterium]|nr:PAS domain S-box protein [Candidatus Melainabacteria bacterium]
MKTLKNTLSLPVRKILIIEDNYDDVELLDFQLDSLGPGRPSLEHCDNLATGLARISKGDVDVVLLDLSLPDANGIDTVARLRAAAPGTPVLVLTGTDDSNLALKTMSYGAQDYLLKGQFDLNVLCRSINYAIERHHVAETAQRLAAIVNSTDDAVISKTLKGTITSWNSGAERLFGYSCEEATGQSIGMIIPKDKPTELPTILAKLSRGESIRNQETVRVKKNGELVDVSFTASPISVDGSIIGGASIDREITDRKKSERILRETEQRLSLALRAASVGVWDLDLVSGEVWRSLKHDEIFGHDSLQPEWNYHIFQTYVVPEDRALVNELFEAGLISGHYEMTCGIIRSDKEKRWITARAETFCDAEGKPIRMMGTIVDVTEQKESESRQRLMAVMHEREDFMATLTHDMKNPLIGANRLLELFVSGRLGELTAHQHELLSTLMLSNSEVLSLIHNLMDVYRLDKEPHSLSLAMVDLTSLISIAVSKMKHFAELRGIHLLSELADQEVVISADSAALERVLQNLLSNALKFTPSGGSITVRLKSADGFVVMEVEDTGPAIKLTEQSKMFKKFSQGEVGKRYVGGSGLGLYLCKQICDAHGGSIVCVSQENCGTTFKVSLPLEVSNGTPSRENGTHSR